MKDISCSVCLENIYFNEKKLSCGHSFHSKCINKWFLIKKNECPYCRTQHYEENIIPNYNIIWNIFYYMRLCILFILLFIVNIHNIYLLIQNIIFVLYFLWKSIVSVSSILLSYTVLKKIFFV